MGKLLVPVRKEGKLPAESLRTEYSLEYGSSVVEMHKDGIQAGQGVLIVDDLLATGGTAAATVRLIERSGASVAGLAFVIELTDLRGRDALVGYRVESLVTW
jgi:adenine phosphoribosyltransferase